jgi:hypothetical protein
MPTTPSDPEPLNPALPDSSWRLWIDGYAAGLRHGLAAGYAEAGQNWTDVTVAACRAARGAIPHAELNRRRRDYRTPALTAEQIRHQAARSWGQAAAAVAARSRRPAA